MLSLISPYKGSDKEESSFMYIANTFSGMPDDSTCAMFSACNELEDIDSFIVLVQNIKLKRISNIIDMTKRKYLVFCVIYNPVLLTLSFIQTP